jgi:division protein CdvB (Snf7/Vps24/ESCRT-III family)
MEEHISILNSRIALGLAMGPNAVATDWTSASFEPPAGWQATGTSNSSTSGMEEETEEFVAVYDRLARCNEQAVLNIHQIRSLDLMIRVLVDRHRKNVQKHLDARETHGELAKAFHAMRELALMEGLREQFDKARFKLPLLPQATLSTDHLDAGSEPELAADGDADADTADEELDDADDAASLTSGTGGCDSDRDEDDQVDE